MLTRLEVDGFKNLLGFSVEFGPFTCIAGPNAVGKSNLFDAIALLSALATSPLKHAADKVREDASGFESPRRLFWTDGTVWAETISLAAEMIVPRTGIDDLSRFAEPKHVHLRYEVVLRFDEGLHLVDERLVVLAGPLTSSLPFPHWPSFVALYRAVPEYTGGSETIFDIQAGVFPGTSSPPSDLARARSTFLSSYANADHPEIMAAKVELSSWRKLVLDPAELRKPDRLNNHWSGRLPTQIRHLLGMDDRLLNMVDPFTDVETPEQWRRACEHLSAQLCARIGHITDLREIWIYRNRDLGTLTLHAQLANGAELSARALSDGTLKYLALAVLELSDEAGLVCLEEPENSLHPSRFEGFFELIRGLATDAEHDPDLDLKEPPDPLRQVIVNTHSSEFVRQVYRHARGELLLATTALTQGPEGRNARVLRLNALPGTWRGGPGVFVPVLSYLGAEALDETATIAAEEGS